MTLHNLYISGSMWEAELDILQSLLQVIVCFFASTSIYTGQQNCLLRPKLYKILCDEVDQETFCICKQTHVIQELIKSNKNIICM